MSDYVPRLKKVYNEKIMNELTEQFKYTSVMQVPKLKKIVLSMGVGQALTNRKLLDLLQRCADLPFDLVAEFGVVVQQLLRGFPSLRQFLPVVTEPGSAFLDDIVLDAEVQHFA